MGFASPKARQVLPDIDTMIQSSFAVFEERQSQANNQLKAVLKEVQIKLQQMIIIGQCKRLSIKDKIFWYLCNRDMHNNLLHDHLFLKDLIV